MVVNIPIDGVEILTFNYYKDGSISLGNDCCYVDDIKYRFAEYMYGYYGYHYYNH